MRAPCLSHTLPAEESGLSSPDRLCLVGNDATVSGSGAATRSHGVCHTVHLSKSFWPLRAAFLLAQGELRILAALTSTSRPFAAGILTFFVALTNDPAHLAGSHEKAKKKPAYSSHTLPDGPVVHTPTTAGHHRQVRGKRSTDKTVPHTLRDSTLIYTHLGDLSSHDPGRHANLQSITTQKITSIRPVWRRIRTAPSINQARMTKSECPMKPEGRMLEAMRPDTHHDGSTTETGRAGRPRRAGLPLTQIAKPKGFTDHNDRRSRGRTAGGQAGLRAERRETRAARASTTRVTASPTP